MRFSICIASKRVSHSSCASLRHSKRCVRLFSFLIVSVFLIFPVYNCNGLSLLLLLQSRFLCSYRSSRNFWQSAVSFFKGSTSTPDLSEYWVEANPWSLQKLKSAVSSYFCFLHDCALIKLKKKSAERWRSPGVYSTDNIHTHTCKKKKKKTL